MVAGLLLVSFALNLGQLILHEASSYHGAEETNGDGSDNDSREPFGHSISFAKDLSKYATSHYSII